MAPTGQRSNTEQQKESTETEGPAFMGSCPVSKSARRYTNRSTTTTAKNLHAVEEMRKNKESTNEGKTTTRRPFCTKLTTAPRHRAEGYPLQQNRVTDVRRTKTLFVCVCVCMYQSFTVPFYDLFVIFLTS